MVFERFEDVVVAVATLVEAAALSPLRPSEQALVDAESSEKRRLEIVAGRALSRHVAALIDPTLARASLVRSAKGAPILDPPGDWCVSLAHDGDLVAAAWARAPVGVDVLTLTRLDQARTVVNHRLEKGAARLSGSPSSWDEAALTWTIWEADGKRSGGGVLAGAMHRVWILQRVEDRPGAVSNGLNNRWFEYAGALVAVATGAS